MLPTQVRGQSTHFCTQTPEHSHTASSPSTGPFSFGRSTLGGSHRRGNYFSQLLWMSLWASALGRPGAMAEEAVAADLSATANATAVSIVEPFTLRDPQGVEYRLTEITESADFVVLAFTGIECPLARLYASRLQTLADAYAERGVRVVGIDPNSQDAPLEIRAFAREHGVVFPILKDLANRVADQVGVLRTPEVVVIDKARRIRYRGRIDDQYDVGVVRDRPQREELRMALDALLTGHPVPVAKTTPVGCLIGRIREPQADSAVTYCNQIARLLQERCVGCHREGEIGPFELQDYDEVVGWGDMILEVVEDRRMPPWHADPQHGSFLNENRLSDDEISLVRTWVENGCPEGDPAQLPDPPTFVSGWQVQREPDVIIPMRDEPFDVPATAGVEGVPYQYFTVETGFTSDRWIYAAEVRPGNTSVVHHIIVYATPPGGRHRRDWIFLTAYVPGLRYVPLPKGAAKRIPAGATLIFEMHYTPVGTPQEDLSHLGLVFADPDEVTHEVLTADITNEGFAIPPRADEHLVTATSRPLAWADAQLWSLSPHMHLRGRSFRYELVQSDGRRQTLLDVPAYDFNWQTSYVLREPLPLPQGSVVYCRATFDNSSRNLANPNPDATVRWGEQSWDEMMIGFCDVIIPAKKPHRPAHKILRAGLDVIGLFDQCDVDQDARVTRKEAETSEVVADSFEKVDVDGDGAIVVAEAVRAAQARGR